MISGVVHVFTKLNFFDVNPPDFLWALASLGNRQLYLGIILMAVAFDWEGSGRYVRPMLALNATMTIFHFISTQINGRHLHIVAPRSTGNYVPWVLVMLSIVGFVLAPAASSRPK